MFKYTVKVRNAVNTLRWLCICRVHKLQKINNKSGFYFDQPADGSRAYPFKRHKCVHVCLYRYGICFEGCQHNSRKLVHRGDHLRGASGVQGKSHKHSNMKHLWMN